MVSLLLPSSLKYTILISVYLHIYCPQTEPAPLLLQPTTSPELCAEAASSANRCLFVYSVIEGEMAAHITRAVKRLVPQ